MKIEAKYWNCKVKHKTCAKQMAISNMCVDCGRLAFAAPREIIKDENIGDLIKELS